MVGHEEPFFSGRVIAPCGTAAQASRCVTVVAEQELAHAEDGTTAVVKVDTGVPLIGRIATIVDHPAVGLAPLDLRPAGVVAGILVQLEDGPITVEVLVVCPPRSSCDSLGGDFPVGSLVSFCRDAVHRRVDRDFAGEFSRVWVAGVGLKVDAVASGENRVMPNHGA